ncbi:hypothetical protein E2C01_046812 [Portunus trituberculatus]|uniref:Uncharacterized protein n=1 Tax=Portunus trituberculatus TaxID=210409 RepID=A0A5B7FZI7_PORTR|nr:hypothetical protein [Portunus trituberculatus]
MLHSMLGIIDRDKLGREDTSRHQQLGKMDDAHELCCLPTGEGRTLRRALHDRFSLPHPLRPRPLATPVSRTYPCECRILETHLRIKAIQVKNTGCSWLSFARRWDEGHLPRCVRKGGTGVKCSASTMKSITLPLPPSVGLLLLFPIFLVLLFLCSHASAAYTFETSGVPKGTGT